VFARFRDALAHNAFLQGELAAAKDALCAMSGERSQLAADLRTTRDERDRLQAQATANERQLHRLRDVDLPRLQERVGDLVREAVDRAYHVAVFGAGAHAEWLDQHTGLASLPSLSVFDSSAARVGRVVLGRLVAPVADLPDARPDVVLISSLAFQDEMAAYVESLGLDGVRIVRCYA
jgi:hypothetical protein